MISTKGLFLVLLTFVNNLSCCSCKYYEHIITGPNYRTTFWSYFFSFRRDFLFDIRHLCERDIYWYASSGIVVHYYVHEVYNITHQSLWIIYCPEWTVLSYHPGVSSCSNGWMDQVWTPWCMYLWSINRKSSHYLGYNCSKAHPPLVSNSWQIKNGQSPHNQ